MARGTYQTSVRQSPLASLPENSGRRLIHRAFLRHATDSLPDAGGSPRLHALPCEHPRVHGGMLDLEPLHLSAVDSLADQIWQLAPRPHEHPAALQQGNADSLPWT